MKGNGIINIRSVGFRGLLQHEIVLIFAVMIILLIGFAVASPYFLSYNNLLSISERIAMILVISVGLTYVIVGGGIDLSTGGLAVFAALICVSVLRSTGNVALAVGLTIAAGLGVGLINGLGVAFLGINSFIMTLGMMMITRSLAEIVSGDEVLAAPKVFAQFFTDRLFGVISPYLLIPLLITLVAHVFLAHSRFGIRIKGIGNNPQAAKYCGIAVARYQIALFVMMGFLSAIVGILLVGRTASASTGEFTQLNLEAVAAPIIGGTSFGGGRGNILGTLIGVIIVGTIQNFLNLMRVDSYWHMVVQGVIVLAAVLMDHLARKI